jgi:hypothetical protein
MDAPPTLEDPAYPGRTGGYVARITGKLLAEAATRGNYQLFLPAPSSSAEAQLIYAGEGPSSPPHVQVPNKFYVGLYDRIKGIYTLDAGSPKSEKSQTYGGKSFIFRAKLVESPVPGVQISIAESGS